MRLFKLQFKLINIKNIQVLIGMIHIPGNQEPRVTSGYSIGHCEVEYFTITDCPIGCFGCSSLGGTEAETVMERNVCLW